MDLKTYRESSTDQKCELLKDELIKVNNKIDNQKGNEADKGVAFVLLPFILMVGYNALLEMFEWCKVVEEVKLSILTIILLILFAIFRSYYKRIK